MKKIIISGVFVVAGALGYVSLDLVGTSAGPADGDKCIAQLVGVAQNGAIDCQVVMRQLNNEKLPTPAWHCNGAEIPQAQECLTAIVGGKKLGDSVRFVGENCPAGVCWKAEVRAAEGAKAIEIEK